MNLSHIKYILKLATFFVVIMSVLQLCLHLLYFSSDISSLYDENCNIEKGFPTMFPECYLPVGFHSNPNLAHLILILSWLMS